MKNQLKGLLASIFILFIANGFAQDVILKTDGDEIKGKVIEVGEMGVKFKKQSNLDGPIYSLQASSVFMITYENGTKEVIKVESSSDANEYVQSNSRGSIQKTESLKKAGKLIRNSVGLRVGSILTLGVASVAAFYACPALLLALLVGAAGFEIASMSALHHSGELIERYAKSVQ